jgi:hypothetical protein
MAESSVSSLAIYQVRVVPCGVSPLVSEEQALLTTASDGRSENGPFSAVGWSVRSSPVLLKPAPLRGQMGSITPKPKVRRPYG